MEFQLQLVLTTCFVSSGFIFVQPHNQTGDQAINSRAKDKSGIRENFQHLFKSIGKNDENQSKIYRDILEQEMARNQRAFDAMNEELRTARNRNAYRKRHFYENSDVGDLVALKREINESDYNDENDSSVNRSDEATRRPTSTKNRPGPKICLKNRLYIDRTPFLMKLLRKPGIMWYATKPQRFRQSTLVQMMNDFFRGREKLFARSALANVGNTEYLKYSLPVTPGRTPRWKEFPVIYINFATMADFNTTKDFRENFLLFLRRTAKNSNIDESAIKGTGDLIRELNVKFRGSPVVVLVDDFDIPFYQMFTKFKKMKTVEKVKNYLDSICAEIKNAGRALGLAFVTGVSKCGSSTLENAFLDLTRDEDVAEAFNWIEDEIPNS